MRPALHQHEVVLGAGQDVHDAVAVADDRGVGVETGDLDRGAGLGRCADQDKRNERYEKDSDPHDTLPEIEAAVSVHGVTATRTLVHWLIIR